MAQTKSDWILREIAKVDKDNVRSALKVASEHVNDGGMMVIIEYILKLQDEVHVLRRAKEFTDGWEDSPKSV